MEQIMYTHVCEWKKMILVKTVPGIGGGRIKESSGGVNSSMIYLMHFKNLCKCHNAPPPSTIKKKIKIKIDSAKLKMEFC
jgi:hypothetical protein